MIGVSYVPAAWFVTTITGTMAVAGGGGVIAASGAETITGTVAAVGAGVINGLGDVATSTGAITGVLHIGPDILGRFTIFPEA